MSSDLIELGTVYRHFNGAVILFLDFDSQSLLRAFIVYDNVCDNDLTRMTSYSQKHLRKSDWLRAAWVEM